LTKTSGVDYELVWEVVTTHVAALSLHIDRVLADDAPP